MLTKSSPASKSLAQERAADSLAFAIFGADADDAMSPLKMLASLDGWSFESADDATDPTGWQRLLVTIDTINDSMSKAPPPNQDEERRKQLEVLVSLKQKLEQFAKAK